MSVVIKAKGAMECQETKQWWRVSDASERSVSENRGSSKLQTRWLLLTFREQFQWNAESTTSFS